MLWTHFCFRGLWEDEMFARQVRHAQSKRKSGTILLQYCRSYWAFEHSGLNFDQRLGFCLRSQPVRPYFYRTPDELCSS